MALLPAGCGDSPVGPTDDTEQLGAEVGSFRPLGPGAKRHIRDLAEPVLVEFGTVKHGEVREQEVEIPLPANLEVDVVPLGYNTTCGCVKHHFVVLRADGRREEFAGEGLVVPESTLRDGDRLLLALRLITAEKDVEDVEDVAYIGQVILQEENGNERWYVPVRVRYGIDAPVTLRPFARLDFGSLPRPVSLTLPVEIHVDPVQASGSTSAGPTLVEPGAETAPATTPTVHFGTPLVVNRDGSPASDLSVRLEPPLADGPWLLKGTFQAGNNRPEGPFHLEVLLPTDLGDGYVIRIPVTGHVISALQVSRPGHFPFGRLDFAEPAECSVVVTDHDPSHDPDFVVVGIRDPNGLDLGEHFTVDITPASGNPRARQVRLRYLGNLPSSPSSFRGTVLLAKTAEQAPLITLDFLGFHQARRDG